MNVNKVFSVTAVKLKAKYMVFSKKITFLLEPKFSSISFLFKNTCNQQIFPSICRAHMPPLKYSAN